MSTTATKLAALAGLGGAKRAVERLLAHGSETHAVLLYGAQGAGKRTLADILVQAWLCQNADNPGCGECRSCVSFGRGTHPDILRINPGGLSNWIRIGQIMPRAEDADILPLEYFFRAAPLVSKFKVVLITSADRMNTDAANALLKTLEEPPPYGKLVLTTSVVRRLPPTVLSRCMAVSCELPASPREPDRLWALSGGAPGRLNQMQGHAESYLAIDALAESLASRDRSEASLVADELRALAEQFEFLGGARAANTEAMVTLATALQVHHPDRPDWAIQATEAHRRIVGNGNPSYVLDAMFMAILG